MYLCIKERKMGKNPIQGNPIVGQQTKSVNQTNYTGKSKQENLLICSYVPSLIINSSIIVMQLHSLHYSQTQPPLTIHQ